MACGSKAERRRSGTTADLRSGLPAVLLLALVTAGCSGDPSTSGAAPVGTSGAAAVPSPPTATSTPAAGVSPKPDVELGQPAALLPRVAVRVVSTGRTTLTANGPGEVAGAGAEVVLRVTNRSAKSVDLGQLAVNAYYGAQKTPASPSSYRIEQQLSGRLKAGRSAEGTYYFRVPSAKFGSLSVEVSSGSSPYVLNFS